MDALILSCGTGGGHNAAAVAIQEELLRRGHGAVILNPYTLKENHTAHWIDQAYIKLVQQAPGLFGGVYCLGNLYRKLPCRSPVYFANRGMISALEGYLDEHPVDIIVTTHLYPGEILTAMRANGISLPPTVFVATDYTCIPFTEETYCDCCVIPSPELEEEFVGRGIPRERIYPLGIPVKSSFTYPLDRAQARQALGMGEGRYFLVAGGSIGAGRLETVIRLLLEHYEGEGAHIIAVCGSNRGLYNSLKERFGERIILLGHTDRMAEYMCACDLVISKPGGLSSTEAAAAGTALIHITPIPGCESRNLDFFARRGMSLPVRHPKEELAEACQTLLEPEVQAEMRRCQSEYVNPWAAADICTLLEIQGKKAG